MAFVNLHHIVASTVMICRKAFHSLNEDAGRENWDERQAKWPHLTLADPSLH
jgi:hypothetical protein